MELYRLDLPSIIDPEKKGNFVMKVKIELCL